MPWLHVDARARVRAAGTAFVDEEETQPSRGRILVCVLNDRMELSIAHSCETEV